MSSLYVTKSEGHGGGAINGRFSGGSDEVCGGSTCGVDVGRSDGGTSICNRNGATDFGFVTGATTNGSSTTVLSIVKISLFKTSVKMVEATVPSYNVSFRN